VKIPDEDLAGLARWVTSLATFQQLATDNPKPPRSDPGQFAKKDE